MEKIKIQATVENLTEVTDFVISSLEEKDCPIKIIMQMELVIEEIFVNIASYAYGSEVGDAVICRQFYEEPRAIELTFIDSGMAYNPLEHEDPDITLAAEDRKIGGLGIFLIKKNVDEIDYKYEDKQNILRIKKFF